MSNPKIISIPWSDILKKSFNFNDTTIQSNNNLYNLSTKMKKTYLNNQPFVFNGKYYYAFRKGICDNIQSYFHNDQMLVINLCLLFQKLLNDMDYFKSLFEDIIFNGFAIGKEFFEIGKLNYNTYLKNKQKYNFQQDKNLISLFIENDVHFTGYKAPYLNEFPIITRFNSKRNILGIELEKTFLLRSINSQSPNPEHKKITFTSSFKLFLDKNNNWQLLDDNIYHWKIFVKLDEYKVDNHKIKQHYLVKNDFFSYFSTIPTMSRLYNQNNINVKNVTNLNKIFNTASNSSLLNSTHIPLHKLNKNSTIQNIDDFKEHIIRGLNLFINNQFYSYSTLYNHLDIPLLHLPKVVKPINRQNSNINQLQIDAKFIYAIVYELLKISQFIKNIYLNIFSIRVSPISLTSNLNYTNILHYKKNTYVEYYAIMPFNIVNDTNIHSFCMYRIRSYIDRKRGYFSNFTSFDLYFSPIYNYPRETPNNIYKLIDSKPLLSQIYKKQQQIALFNQQGYKGINDTINNALMKKFRTDILPIIKQYNPNQNKQIDQQFTKIQSLLNPNANIHYIDLYITLKNFMNEYTKHVIDENKKLINMWREYYISIVNDNKSKLYDASLQFEKMYFNLIQSIYQYL